MWVVHYRPDNVSQEWVHLDSYDNKIHALINAYQVSGKYFMVKILDPEGMVIWSS